MTTTLPTPEKTLTMPDLTVVETERDVFARNREKITTALRTNGDRQIIGSIRQGPPNGPATGFCFVGCAADALGL